MGTNIKFNEIILLMSFQEMPIQMIMLDIKMWDYKKLPEVFAPEKKDKMLVFNVSTENELVNAMDKINNNPDKFAFIEVHMGMDDVPQILGELASLFENQNGY